MPMLVGIIYGLTFQALALSQLGRHDEARRRQSTRRSSCSTARAPRAPSTSSAGAREVLAAAGQHDEARARRERARDAEVDAKAAKLRDPELRKHFLASRQRAV